MSLLDRVAPTSVRPSRPSGAGGSLLRSFGYGLIAPVAFGLLLLVPVLAGWTLDPRTSTQWSDALAMASTIVGLSLRGSISVPHNGIEGLHFAPMMLTGLFVALVRWAHRPVQHALDDEGADGSTQQYSALTFAGGVLVASVAVAGLSSTGPAPVTLWTVVPGALLAALAGVAWSIWRDGDGVDLPWWTHAADRLHLNVRRGLRPALESVGLLLLAGTLLTFALVMMQLDRVGKVAALLDVSGSGAALLWLAQAMALPNLVMFALSWTSGAPIALGAGHLTTSESTVTTLPSVPVLGALPEPGALPGWAAAAVLVPMLVGGYLGWRSTAAMPKLTHLGRKLQVAASGCAIAVAVFAVLIWWSRAGISPGALDLFGPSLWTIVLLGCELTFGAAVATTAAHFLRRRR
ncbi:DUF6350 family protein [Yimella sp. cx-51]|uniref:cell division protein PerM n=1 Tax=Yimella sp. cx-51 TaxID=2770551 RepID=UPI00165E56CA|nr:DUF6350 family protein [Yimella sp. cx-51]MBC9958223.1 hypothetical protein [Yimella sp. cx-51]MBD2758919.1 hypothetical protein [Yimella sp. cx-573]QTH38744.1 hypothetical protein J5M86_03645 [Yimella sp. cx-51]